VRILALPAMVFILLELRELEELGVLSVPDGLSELSCHKNAIYSHLPQTYTRHAKH
jgi:hypothetical protein